MKKDMTQTQIDSTFARMRKLYTELDLLDRFSTNNYHCINKYLDEWAKKPATIKREKRIYEMISSLEARFAGSKANIQAWEANTGCSWICEGYAQEHGFYEVSKQDLKDLNSAEIAELVELKIVSMELVIGVAAN